MKPAAVLVRAFQVERRRPFEVIAGLKDEGVGGALIEPNVQDIHDRLEIFRLVIGA